MDFGIAIANAFVIALAFYLIAEKFMNHNRLVKYVCFFGLFVVEALVMLFLPNYGEIGILICFVIITFSINVNINNYLKSVDIALSILLFFTVIVLMLAGVLLSAFSGTFSTDNYTYNIIMQISILAFAIILRKYKDFSFNLPIDTKLLWFSLTFKAILLLIMNLAIPVIFANLAYLSYSLFYIVQFLFTVIIIVGFFYTKYVSKRTCELEAESKKMAVELTSQLVESENINKRYEEINRFKHYCISVYKSIVLYITTDDMQGLKKYYTEHIAPMNEQLNKELDEYEQIKHIHLNLIKARFIELINTVSQLPNVNLYIHVDNVIDFVAVKEIDLFTVLNIFIDNAVEETRTQNKGEITIEITQTHDRFIFEIRNSLNGYESTPKPHNTHKGNEIVIGICEQYPNMDVSTDIEYGMYMRSVAILNC